MDTWFNSPVIPITTKGSVLLKWQQSFNYCCASGDELVVEVSSNNFNWTTYDAISGREANTSVPNPSSAAAEQMSINVSAQLANQTTVYVRFRMSGASHYYWMIDDFAIVEGASDAMELVDWSINFSDTTINPIHSIVPQLLIGPLTFDGALFNAGSNTQTAVGLEVEVVQDSTYFGGIGSGLVYISSTFIGIPVPTLQRDVVRVGPYLNIGDGYYRAIFRAFSNSTNQNPFAAIGTQSFIVSDTVLAKELGLILEMMVLGIILVVEMMETFGDL